MEGLAAILGEMIIQGTLTKIAVTAAILGFAILTSLSEIEITPHLRDRGPQPFSQRRPDLVLSELDIAS